MQARSMEPATDETRGREPDPKNSRCWRRLAIDVDPCPCRIQLVREKKMVVTCRPAACKGHHVENQEPEI